MEPIKLLVKQADPSCPYNKRAGVAGKWYVAEKYSYTRYLRPDLTIQLNTGWGEDEGNVGWWDTEEEARQVVANYYEKVSSTD